MDIKTKLFAIEKYAKQHQITNTELRFMEDERLRDVVIDVCRSVPIRREMFEEEDKRTVSVQRRVGRTVVRARVPATWWDHAKRDIRALRWAFWLKPVRWVTAERVVEHGDTYFTVKHYRTEVEIIDDGKQLPHGRQTIERREYGTSENNRTHDLTSGG